MLDRQTRYLANRHSNSNNQRPEDYLASQHSNHNLQGDRFLVRTSNNNSSQHREDCLDRTNSNNNSQLREDCLDKINSNNNSQLQEDCLGKISSNKALRRCLAAAQRSINQQALELHCLAEAKPRPILQHNLQLQGHYLAAVRKHPRPRQAAVSLVVLPRPIRYLGRTSPSSRPLHCLASLNSPSPPYLAKISNSNSNSSNKIHFQKLVSLVSPSLNLNPSSSSNSSSRN